MDNVFKPKPVLIVNGVVFSKLKDNVDLLKGIYGNTNTVGKSIELETTTLLTLLANAVTLEELNHIVCDSSLLMKTIFSEIILDNEQRLNIGSLIKKCNFVKATLNNISSINNEKVKQNVLTEVKQSNLLDLKNCYSSLAEGDMLDIGNAIILKVEDNLLFTLKSSKVSIDLYKVIYGIYLNTNSIASNTDFNKKVSNNVVGSILPYIYA